MGHVGTFPVADIVNRGSIRSEDVARLRRDCLEDGAVGQREADQLVEMHHACPVQDPAWPVFFVDVLTDYVVQQAVPEGYVNAANAAWLLSRIAPEGRVATKAGLDLLVNVLDKARWAPVGLSRCALDQVRRAVVTGQGPLRSDRGAEAGTITATEVELLRRILYAFGSDGHVAVTRTEAEVLLDIDDALVSGAASAEWSDLYVKAIANVVMTASGYAIPTRERALARTLADAAAASGAADAGSDETIAGYGRQSNEERALARLERQRIEIITNEEILGEEASWLAERLGNGGRISPAAADLAACLRRAVVARHLEIHPDLAAVIGRRTALAA